MTPPRRCPRLAAGGATPHGAGALPASMARMAMAARARGMAAQATRSIAGSSSSASRGRGTSVGKRSRNPASTRSSLVCGSKPTQVAPASISPPTMWKMWR